MENIISVLLGVVSNILFQIWDSATGSRVNKYIENRLSPIKKIFPFDLTKNKKITLAFGYIPPKDLASTYTVQQGDLLALLRATQLATIIGNDRNILAQEGNSLSSNYESYPNIFSISGPKWNSLTKTLLGRIGAPIKITQNPKGITIIDKLLQVEIDKHCTYVDGVLPEICYGLIFSGKIENSNGTDQNILLCFGVTTLSTVGSIIFLQKLVSTGGKSISTTEYKVYKQRKWGLLLEIKNVTPNKPQSPIHENDLDIRVIRTFNSADFLNPYI